MIAVRVEAVSTGSTASDGSVGAGALVHSTALVQVANAARVAVRVKVVAPELESVGFG